MNVDGVLVARDRTIYEWRGTRAKSLMREIGRYDLAGDDRPARVHKWQAWCVDCGWTSGDDTARRVVIDLRDHHSEAHKPSI